MKIVKVKIDKIVPDKSNVRVHDTNNIATIKSSLLQFSQYQPLVLQKSSNRIIVGHGRLEAIRQLHAEGQWPTDDVDCVLVDLDDKRAALYALSDNRTAESSKWDYKRLVETIKELDTAFSVNSFGFDNEFMSDALSKALDKKDDGPSIPDVSTDTNDSPEHETGAGRMSLFYRNDEEKKFWIDKLGVPADFKKSTLFLKDLNSHEKEQSQD